MSSIGLSRGKPLDRYYIEKFLSKYTTDIQGRVLEVAESTYTIRFGGSKVKHADVLHFPPGNDQATFVADITRADSIPDNLFDCLIFTQTLHFIYDFRAALVHSFRILKPGGVLLATMTGISQISRYDMDRWGDYWRFTTASAQHLFEECFPLEKVTVESYGNVMVACAFLHGLVVHELNPEELEFNDPDYQVLITVRAVKP